MSEHDPGTPDISNLDRGVAEREQLVCAIDEAQKEEEARKRAEARLTATMTECGVDRAMFMRWKGSTVRLMKRDSWGQLSARAIDACARKFEAMHLDPRLEKIIAMTKDGAK